MRDRPRLPPQRSIAMSSALRTRTSSNGFFSMLKATSRLSVQLDSSMRILSPIAVHQPVALGRRDAAELAQHLAALHGVEHGGRLQHEHAA